MALLLAVDVSGSVDHREYVLQMQGLADAMRDGSVADALVAEKAQVALMQWTGSSRQKVTIPWTSVDNHEAVHALAERIASDERVWRNFSTAIGDALFQASLYFSQTQECERRVIDVSGDGVSNEGVPPEDLRAMMGGLTVNAIAIETDDTDLTSYFYDYVITGPGSFVFTADGFEDYPRQIRRKLQREVLDRLSHSSDAEFVITR